LDITPIGDFGLSQTKLSLSNQVFGLFCGKDHTDNNACLSEATGHFGYGVKCLTFIL
jgi:hypothetical protein